MKGARVMFAGRECVPMELRLPLACCTVCRSVTTIQGWLAPGESRSQARRLAAQRGEPAPVFGARDDLAADYQECPCGALRVETAP